MSEVKKWISDKWITLKGTECKLAGRMCTAYKASESVDTMAYAVQDTKLEKASAFGEV